MKKSFLAIVTCIIALNINATQERSRQKSHTIDYVPCVINRIIVGLDSHATLEEYIERLHRIGLFLIVQHKIFMAAYSVYNKPLEEFQKSPAFQRALEKVQTLSIPESLIKHYFRIITICCLLNASPLPAQESMGQFEKYDFVKQARNKASIALRILNSSGLVNDQVMFDRLRSIEKNTTQELDTYFDVRNLLTLDTLYAEIIRTLRLEILHAKKMTHHRTQYQDYMNVLPESLLPQSIHQELLLKEEEYAGMDLRSLTHTSIRIGVDLLNPRFQESETHLLSTPGATTQPDEPVTPVRPKPIRMDSLAPKYSLESAYIIQHEHLVRICDPENAMAIDLDLSQESRMLHTYPATPLFDSYAPAVSLGFMTTFSKNLLKKNAIAIQKYRFSPLVDQYIAQLGNEYLVLRDTTTMRECTFIPEDMNGFQCWFAHGQHHNMRSVIRIEFDGHAYLYTMKARIPCTFSYEFDPVSNAIVSRSMALYP
ncbi:MAG TPA: hypothetical protein PKD74_04790 [Candidatus Dependentiae bacterium]|nr:hypothetical protein [Candidatus Dependentiae bacterium]